jgi:uncharacterized membrane protein YuzA (DUF378 family)
MPGVTAPYDGVVHGMSKVKLITFSLPLIGGLNWGLVAAAKLDLVAKLTGNRFGETNAASRAIYGAVGVASLVAAAQLAGIRQQAD